MISRSISRAFSRPVRVLAGTRYISWTPAKFQKSPKELLENEKEYVMPEPPLKRESEYEMNKRLEMVERLKAVILGILAVGGILGGYELYQNKAKIKYYLFNEYDLSGFDESYKKITNKKQKPKEVFVPSNPNPSSVPGLYIVGNNANKQLINENSTMVSNFKRNPWFDDKILKDIKIGAKSSCAIDSKGDLIQWGNGYKVDHDPEYTIKGANLITAEISNGVIYCLTKKSELIYVPENAADRPKFKSKTWFGLRSQNFKKVEGVKFQQIKTGEEHLLALSKDKKAYVMATGLAPLKQSRGQFGLPAFSQFDKPPLPNELFELTNLNYFTDSKTKKLKKRNLTAIACGDYHNLALDEFGNVWSWGVNTYGSLGHVINYNTEIISTPRKIDISKAYFKRNELPQCVDISAGGYSSFGSFKSSNIYNIFEDYVKNNGSNDDDAETMRAAAAASEDNMIHLGWGKCLNGQLGIGHYVHCQNDPIKLKNIQNAKNFNEATQSLEAINVKSWSIGPSHSIVTLDNNDVLTFGDNEFSQLGNGKRVKSPTPSNIPKLIEPAVNKETDTKNKLKVKKYAEINNRLQLNEFGFQNTKGKSVPKIEQKIYAGNEASAIYYSPI